MIKAEVTEQGNGKFRVITITGSQGWGVGVDFATRESAQRVADVIEEEANRGSQS